VQTFCLLQIRGSIFCDFVQTCLMDGSSCNGFQVSLIAQLLQFMLFSTMVNEFRTCLLSVDTCTGGLNLKFKSGTSRTDTAVCTQL